MSRKKKLNENILPEVKEDIIEQNVEPADKILKKIDFLYSVQVIIEQLKDNKIITEKRFLRLQSGVSTLIYDLKQKLNNRNLLDCRTSVYIIQDQVNVSKLVNMDKKDIRINQFVNLETKILNQFIEYMQSKGYENENFENILKLLIAQDQVDDEILKIKEKRMSQNENWNVIKRVSRT